MRELYKQSWERLRHDRLTCEEIDREATPVLFFGSYKTARVATVGLNPSEDEFRAKNSRRTPLLGDAQRFVHWPADGRLADDLLDEAFRRMEGYFVLGKAYRQWFEGYDSFLSALGATFEDGLSCHTDLCSPFATRTGISQCSRRTRSLLRQYGPTAWVEVLSRIPFVEVVFGHGGTWKEVPDLLGFAKQGWQGISTRFDNEKGGASNMPWPYLLSAMGKIPASGREVAVFWWKPNRNGSPLTWLSAAEKKDLGAEVLNRAHDMGYLR